MTFARALEGIATPLDGLRQTALGWALRLPLLPGILTRRDRRLSAIATVQALAAFALALMLPTLLFALGPVLLGVAHVAADVRYLVLRRKLARFWRAAIWAGCAGIIALRALEETGVLTMGSSRGELALASAWVAVALVAGAREAGSYRRAALAAPILALAAWAALSQPLFALMAVVHLHNLAAVVVWAALFRGRLAAMVLPLSLIAAGTVALVSGSLHHLILEHARLEAFGLGLLELSSWLAPGFDPPAAVGLTVAYVFLQSIHYAIWLIVIPQTDSAGQGTLTFRMSARSLLRDFGGGPLLAVALGAAVVMASACFDVHETRRLYLSLAMFHVYLELAVLAHFWARGRAGVGSAPLNRSAAGRPAASVATVDPASARAWVSDRVGSRDFDRAP